MILHEEQANDVVENPITAADEVVIKQTAEVKAKLLYDLITFTQVFYKLRTGRDFKISQPVSRESHYKVISRALDRVFRGECNKLIINCPPRYGKTSLAMNFIAYTLAHFPDSNYLYISISSDLATRATAEIRDIITCPYYKKIFGVSLREDSAAKDSFMTTAGGSIEGLGVAGSVTGKGGGLRGVNRWGGCLFIDDVHKPDSVTSDVVRKGTIDWFFNTLLSRRNAGESTPIIYIGQRVHSDDLAAHLMEQGGWETVVLPALDASNNALCPELHTAYELKKMQELDRYVFAAQFMQNPSPQGGGLFRESDFLILDKQPDLIKTFICVDTAETANKINDATAMSLFGLYRIEQFGQPTDIYALHWLDCIEIFCEPKDLRREFMEFYATSCKWQIPSFCAIEKKSTGTTLVSILKDVQGLNILPVEVSSKSGSKMDRFIQMQPYIAQKLVTLPYGAKHTKMCIEHMTKITSNDSHRRDDICDSVQQAIMLTMIDKSAMHFVSNKSDFKERSNKIIRDQIKINNARLDLWQ
jgi:predicted phage terminase large subunit-like protein